MGIGSFLFGTAPKRGIDTEEGQAFYQDLLRQMNLVNAPDYGRADIDRIVRGVLGDVQSQAGAGMLGQGAATQAGIQARVQGEEQVAKRRSEELARLRQILAALVGQPVEGTGGLIPGLAKGAGAVLGAVL